MATTTHFASGETWTGSDPFAGTTAADRARNFARARRHTRLVRALRWSLPGAGVGIVVLYFVMILDTTGWVAGLPHLEVPRIIPDNLTMDNPSYEGFNKDGGKYVVRAKTAVQDLVNTQFVRLNGITGDMTDANKSKTHLTAAHGEFNTKTNQLDLSGGIDIVADSGLKAKLSRATILTNDNVIFSKEPVVVDMPSGTIRSNEMRLLNKSREIAFIDDVKAHLVPEKGEAAGTPTTGATKPAAPLIGGGEGPIDITANRLDIDDTGKTATFTGNVKAQQADAALETAALEVRYEGGGNGCHRRGGDTGRRRQDTTHRVEIPRRHDARAAGPRHRFRPRLRRRQPGCRGQRKCRDDIGTGAPRQRRQGDRRSARRHHSVDWQRCRHPGAQ
ncbi:MAG: LPS export ABC transporter periplasmic protein LptC [Hyphomicrobium sp.]|nr:LPS export ABC transporter periplasmic protein LptC [Hyphomicrobium sp.]